jgi:hypothetical protein
MVHGVEVAATIGLLVLRSHLTHVRWAASLPLKLSRLANVLVVLLLVVGDSNARAILLR